MKNHILPVLVVLMAQVLITICGRTSGGIEADARRQNGAASDLTENDLANAIYRIDSLGTIRLDKGKFERRYGEGTTQTHKVALEKVAFGDLDHDGLADAAVILAWQSGGTGTYKYLMAMRNTGGEPRQQDSLLLGDRVQIQALSIGDGRVRLEKRQAGSDDPACCPTQQAQQAYVLRDGKWAESDDKIADSSETLTGIVWKWERYEDTTEPRHFIIDDPDNYTLVLLPDGTYRVKADCNRMQGRYFLEGRSIKIVPGAATLAECGPQSRYLEYLKDLSSAVNFGMREGRLVLNLVLGGEILVFGNGGPFSGHSGY